MSYYIWRSDSKLAKKYMHVSIDPVNLDHEKWITGKHMTKPAVMTLVADKSSPAALSDDILTSFRIPVLSPKALEALEKLGVKNLEYFPIKIKSKNGKIDETYKIANVVGLVNCLDKKHAKFTTFSDEPDKISYLQKYKIFENKVPKKILIFRLGEFPYHLLVHESVKKAFQKAGLTGSEFILTEKFA